MKKNTYRIALSALICALCIISLLMGSVITFLDLSLCAIASGIMVFSVIEIGGFYPWLIWAAVSLLSLLLLPDKFGALVFFLFAGYYPMLKRYIEMLPKFAYFLKLIIFNLCLSCIIFLSNKILGIPKTEITFSIPVYLICNFLFILYDISLTRMITFYIFKLRDRLGISKRMH
ncbi:MAG: hypothetical protein IKU52_05505 [Clostridia bacterium]|nr:hypothetical protein [Clostridia bacterium]